MKAGKLLLVLAAVGLLGLGGFALCVKASDTASAGASTRSSDRPLARFIRGQIGRFLVLQSQIDLTDDQKQQIASILKSHKAEIVQVVQPIVEKKRALREAVSAPIPDEQAIRAAANELGRTIGDAAVLAAKIKQEVSPILTDEQRKQISDYRTDTDHAVDDLIGKLSAQN
jgi:Spy/CpxP family protein refolding chaperone